MECKSTKKHRYIKMRETFVNIKKDEQHIQSAKP